MRVTLGSFFTAFPLNVFRLCERLCNSHADRGVQAKAFRCKKIETFTQLHKMVLGHAPHLRSQQLQVWIVRDVGVLSWTCRIIPSWTNVIRERCPYGEYPMALRVRTYDMSSLAKEKSLNARAPKSPLCGVTGSSSFGSGRGLPMRLRLIGADGIPLPDDPVSSAE